MTEFKDVEVIKARDPETGEEVEAVVVPAGFYLCLISEETAARFAEWQEAKAVRIKVEPPGLIASLEVTDDEEWVTGPGAS